MATTSMHDVARHAGVSVGTVSNVLNRPDIVASATCKRVLDAIDQLGFVRNESARQLRAGRSRVVALVVLDIANPFFADVARGAEAAAEENGSLVMLCGSGEDAERERRSLEQLEELRVRGVLITPTGHNHAQLERLRRRSIPVILVDHHSRTGQHCSTAVDDVLGGRLAGEHLLAQGHHRIGFVGGPFTLRQVTDRHQGLTAALTRHTVAAPQVFQTPNLTVTAGRAAGAELASLPAERRPTAVFCGNDLLALGVLAETTSRGLRVPQDLALIGYDDIDFAATAAVPLSSVRQPRERLGRAAAELLLLEETETPHQHRQLVFEPELVVRQSSSVPAPGSTAR